MEVTSYMYGQSNTYAPQHISIEVLEVFRLKQTTFALFIKESIFCVHGNLRSIIKIFAKTDKTPHKGRRLTRAEG